VLPGSASTDRNFDADRFAALKPGAIFYNVGRGTTVDQEALRAVLLSGHLSVPRALGRPRTLLRPGGTPHSLTRQRGGDARLVRNRIEEARTMIDLVGDRGSCRSRRRAFSMLVLAAAAVGCEGPTGGTAPPELTSVKATSSAQVVRGARVSAVRTATRTWSEIIAAGPSFTNSPAKVMVPPPSKTSEVITVRSAAAAIAPSALPTPTLPSPALDANFFGTIATSWTPPDTMGAVGPNHLLIAVNGKVQVQDKAGTVLSSTDLYGFFSSVAPYWRTFDPSSLYDPLSGRFVILAMSGDINVANAAVLIAVSQTSDPTGGWHFFAFDADPNDVGFPDFGKLGINKNWIVSHTPINETAQGLVLVCEKAAMFAGTDSCTEIRIEHMRSRPVISFDASEENAYLLRIMTGPSDGRIAIDTITGAIGNEVLNLEANLLTLPESFASQSGPTMPQLGSATKIFSDPGGNVSTLIQRDGSFWGSLTMCFPIDTPPTRCGFRYFQSTPTGTLQQYGGLEDPTGVVNYTFANLAVNKNHDMLIGFARFTAEQYPAAAYAYRSGADPAGVLRSDAVYRPGEAPYHNIRWGDYTIAMVDPTNDLDMWTLQEYSAAPSTTWALQWAKVAAHGATSAVTLNPVADAHVQDGTNAANNFGNLTTLLVKATASGGTNRWAYLRFPLTGVNGAVNAARLRLHGSRPTTANGIPDVVYAVSNNTWTETGITWNNKPLPGEAQGFGVAIHTNAHYYEWDVTPFVKAQKAAGATAVSLAVRMSANVSIGPDTFSSRQAASNRPELVVAFASGADTVVFNAEADAHVRDGTSANTNFGTATSLESKNSTVSGNHRRTFVRFPITGVGSNVTAATLRLFGNSVTTAKMVGVYSNSNTTWGETSITWNGAPAIGPKQGASKSVGTTAATVTWDVTSYVQAQRTAGATAVTFELKQDTANNEGVTSFASRQNATTENWPTLEVTSN